MDQNNPVETTNLDDSKAADTFHIPIQSSGISQLHLNLKCITLLAMYYVKYITL